MIFHNKYTMPLSRLSLMLETSNMRLVCRYRFVPRFIVRYGYIKFMTMFDEMFGGGGDFKEEVVRLMMWIKIKNILRPMHSLLMTEDNEYAADLFEQNYGKRPESTEDLELIRNEMKRLSNRYKIMFRKKKIETPQESVTFENIIQGVETVLDKPYIPRDVLLYQFEQYYLRSLERIAEIKAKKHG